MVYVNAPIYLNMGLQLAALSEDVKDPVGSGTGCGGVEGWNLRVYRLTPLLVITLLPVWD